MEKNNNIDGGVVPVESEFQIVTQNEGNNADQSSDQADVDINELLGSMDDPNDDTVDDLDPKDQMTYFEDRVSTSEIVNVDDYDLEDDELPEISEDQTELPSTANTAKSKKSPRIKKNTEQEAAIAEDITEDSQVTSKAKRNTRKKTASNTPADIITGVMPKTDIDDSVDFIDSTILAEAQEGSTKKPPAPARISRTPRKKVTTPPVLTIESRAEVDTQENLEDAAWHEIRNAYRTRKILTGTLGGIEQTETGKTIILVNFNDFRVVIPMKEMMINLNRSPSGQEYSDLMLRQNKILGNMLGAEIDFIVKGIDGKTRSIVASRKDAMLKKRQTFYLGLDAAGMYRIYEGRVVQARVIAVAEKVIRVEAFGVECSIMARDLAWEWIGDAHERFSVGDQILVRINKVTRNGLEDISIHADIKSVTDNTSHENLKKCRVQSKYAGTVTDVHKGVVFVRLTNGVNAIAHSCYDRRLPGKKDDVSFAVTKIDEEQGVAVGIITRIIKQNL